MNLADIARPPASPVPRDLLEKTETVTDALSAMVERFPDFECFTLLDRHREERRLSLRRLWARAKDVQAALVARGLRPGECVLLSLPTGAEVISAYFGAMLAGGIPAVVTTPFHRHANPRAYTRLVGAILTNSAARVLYCDEDVARLFDGPAGKLLGETVLVTPSSVPEGVTPLETFRPKRGDVATIQYSSGSTGAPKGILLSHRAVLNNIRNVRDGIGLGPADVSVNWAPLYHDMGLIAAFLLPLLCGCPAVLIPTMDFLREPALWLWAIHRYRGTVAWAPNAGFMICARRIDEKEIEGLDLTSWRAAINVAEPVLVPTIEAFTRRFQPHGFAPETMNTAWGLAENVLTTTMHSVQDPPLVEIVERHVLATESIAKPTKGDGLACVAVGRCLPNNEVEIRDRGGCKLGERQVGEIWIRTNSLFEGYKGDPELTAQVLVDGWLNSGDRGYVADEHLFFISRDKDLIVIGGEKYAPHDVESAINRVPGVREGCAIAFGVMDEGRGTEVLAAVVETRETEAERLEALGRAIRVEVTRETGLGIRHLKLVPPGGIEKTTSGKLARAATRGRYADEFGSGR